MDEITLIVGTTKGAFLLTAGTGRRDWRLSGPFCDGWPINHAAGDPASGALWAAGGGDWNGAGVWRSVDGGGTWALTKLSNGQFDDWIADEPRGGGAVRLEPSPPAPVHRADHRALVARPLRRPALRRRQAGGAARERRRRRELVDGHGPHRPSVAHASGSRAAPGSILHSIVADPAERGKLWVGISAAGVFATEDGGRVLGPAQPPLQRRRRGEAAAGPHPRHADEDVGLCVHNFVRAPAAAPTAATCSTSRTTTASSAAPTAGAAGRRSPPACPRRFGFPIAVHPRDPETIWVAAAQRRQRGPLPAGRLRRGLALARRRRELDGAAAGAAGARLLLHRAAPGDGDRPGRARRGLLRHEQRLGLRQRRRRRELGGDRPAPAHGALRRGPAPGLTRFGPLYPYRQR